MDFRRRLPSLRMLKPSRKLEVVRLILEILQFGVCVFAAYIIWCYMPYVYYGNTDTNPVYIVYIICTYVMCVRRRVDLSDDFNAGVFAGEAFSRVNSPEG